MSNVEERSTYQYFLVGNALGFIAYSMIGVYNHYNKKENDRDKINIQNEKILSMRTVINLQLEEIETKNKFIKEQSEIIDQQDIEIGKKVKIIETLRANHKKVRDKIVIEYED